MKAARFLPPRKEAANETKASHEVMELVRQSSKLGLLVIQLREGGRSWSSSKPGSKLKPSQRLKVATTSVRSGLTDRDHSRRKARLLHLPAICIQLGRARHNVLGGRSS
jgi:hypothetical protein